MNISTWPSPRLLLRDHLVFLTLTAAGLLATVTAITIGYDMLSDLEVNQSFWIEAALAVAPWYAVGVGGYLMIEVFPRYILYGDTRKRFAQRIALFGIPFCIAIAVLALIGLLFEKLVYRIGGWNQAIPEENLFDSATDVPAFLLQFLVVLFPWYAFGALIGAAYVARQELLIVLIPVAILGVALVNILLGLDDGPAAIVERLLGLNERNVIAAIAASVLFTVAALVGTRVITRTAAIKSQAE